MAKQQSKATGAKSSHHSKIAGKELHARRAVLQSLLGIMQKKQSLDVMLSRLREDAGLSTEDRYFAEHLLKSTLKHWPLLQPYIAGFLIKPLAQLPLQAQLLLALGACQIHFCRVPAYAAVNTSVELARHCGLHRLTGMMNVVLKKISHTACPKELSMTMVPDWLGKRLTADYGHDALAIAQASLSDITYIDISCKPDTYAQICTELASYQPITLPNRILRIHQHKTVFGLAGYDAGDWWVQDIAAALPVQGIAHVLKGAKVLDACAAPGGKTLQAASYGADVTALDRSEKRLTRMQENLNRTGLTAGLICADILHYSPQQSYDVVILDAPCSASGTLRRHPDILYHRTEDDIRDVITLQTAMLDKAWQWVRPQGYLLYCVCSLFHEEGETQIARWLEHQPDAAREAFVGLPSFMINELGEYRAHPLYLTQHGGMDGFFAALLRKTSDE